MISLNIYTTCQLPNDNPQHIYDNLDNRATSGGRKFMRYFHQREKKKNDVFLCFLRLPRDKTYPEIVRNKREEKKKLQVTRTTCE